jgi:hypothetical protein
MDCIPDQKKTQDRGPLKSFLLLAGSVLLALPLPCGCCGDTCILGGRSFLWDPKPWHESNWDNHKPMDFRVGDRFQTLCPMFLLRSGSGLHLQRCSEEEIQACLAAPKSWKHVVQILYPGTEIEVMAIKMSDFYKDPLVYVRIADVGPWIGVLLYEYSGHPSTIHYIRGFFKKIESTESVPMADPPIDPAVP